MSHSVEGELLAQAAALRALARVLVGEQHADDLVQETALQALTRPPQHFGAVRSWLVSVLRHFASKHHRGERRRLQREAGATPREPEVAPDAIAEQRDMLQQLTAALVALPEPYQRTLLLRFFQDLTPSAIAAQLGEPLATVKSRLQRGLAMLRERLDRNGKRDWRAALAGTFGIEGAGAVATGAAITTGVLLMGSGVKLAIGGAAAIAVAATLFFAGGGAPVAGPGTNDARSGAVAATGAVGGKEEVVAGEGAQRSEVKPAVNDAAALATIRGRCVDESGVPLAECDVRLQWRALENQGLTTGVAITDPVSARQATGGDGRFEFHAAATPGMRIDFWVNHPDRVSGSMRWSSLERGQVVELGDLVLPIGSKLRAHIEDEQGVPLAKTNVYVEWTKPDFPSSLSMNVGNGKRTDDRGNLVQPDLLPGEYRLSFDQRELVRGGTFRVPRGASTIDVLAVVATVKDSDVLAGVVVDEAGQPLPEIRVYAYAANRALEGETTSKDGAFQFLRRRTDSGDPVMITIAALGFEEVFPEERFPWGRSDLRFVLHRGATLEVRVLRAADGVPVDDYEIWVLPDQTAFRSHDQQEQRSRGPGLHEHGVVTLQGLRRGPHFVVVQSRDPALGWCRPQAVTIADPAPTRLEVRLPAASERVVRVQRADGLPVVNTKVQLVDPVGRRAVSAVRAVVAPEWAWVTRNNQTPVGREELVILIQESSTDANGEVRLRGRTDLRLAVRALGPGHVPIAVDDVAMDEPSKLVLTVGEGATLRGRASPELGWQGLREVAGFPNTGPIGDDDRFWRPKLTLLRGRLPALERHPSTGEVPIQDDGSFEFTGVPPGRWRIWLEAGMNEKRVNEELDEVDLRDGAVTEMPLDLSSFVLARLDGVVIWNGRPLANTKAWLNIVLGRGADGRLRETNSAVTTDGEGRFAWRGRAGEVSLVYSYTDDLRARETVVLMPGGSAAQTFTGGSGKARVRLLGVDGKPIAGLGVTLVAGATRRYLPGTDPAGSTEREASAGSYRVEVLPKRMLDPAAREAVRQAHSQDEDPMASVWLRIGELEVKPGATTEVEIKLPAEWER